MKHKKIKALFVDLLAVVIVLIALIYPTAEFICGLTMIIASITLLAVYALSQIKPNLIKYKLKMFSDASGFLSIGFILIIGILMMLNTFSSYTSTVFEKVISRV